MLRAGLCGCSLDNINIGTVRSGREIGGLPEWNVTVINNCSCPQKLIKLTCGGFQSAEYVDPKTLGKTDEDKKCMLNEGNPLEGFASIAFSYAWDPPFLLFPADSVIISPCGGP